MRILLDTQIWLWMLASPARFRTDARAMVEDVRNVLVLSAVSSWEIAIKHELGKLSLPEAPEAFVPARIRTSGVSTLPVEHSHALRVAALELHHRDPFDRLLVAQAQLEGLPILTADPVFGRYEVDVLET